MKPKKQIDWIGIKNEYRCGMLSIRTIAKLYGVSHVAIVKKAKKEHWQHDLAERVRQEIKRKLAALDAIEVKRGLT
jgi:uncharacterized protein YjcR